MQPQTPASLNKQIRDLETEVRIQYKHFSDNSALLHSLLWLGYVGRLLQTERPDLQTLRKEGVVMAQYIQSQPDFAGLAVGELLLAFAGELSGLQEIFYPVSSQNLWRRRSPILWLLVATVGAWAFVGWILSPAVNPDVAYVVQFTIGGIAFLSAIALWVRTGQADL